MGTLIRAATGFCAAFLSASAFTADACVWSVATWVPSGPTGVSCANSGTVDREKTASAIRARIIRMCNSDFLCNDRLNLYSGDGRVNSVIVLYACPQLLHHLINAEAGWRLARRKFFESHQKLAD